MNDHNRKKGFILVIIGAIFWGIGGTVSQKLFQYYSVDVNWLVSTRLLLAGILLLAIQYIYKDRVQIFKVWKHSKTAIMLLIFGLLGMLTVQYTYMASIQHGNAAVATLLQYLAPIIILLYETVWKRNVLTKRNIMTVSLALIGCFLLLTNGSLAQLSVPTPAIIWGLLSAASLAFYTLYAVSLLKQFDSLVIVGWAMIVGAVALSFIHPPWDFQFSEFPVEGYVYLVFVIIFGTMIAFWFYIESLQHLSASEASILSSVEPLAAIIATVFWLKEDFGVLQWLGSLCIIGMILLVAGNKKTTAIQPTKTASSDESYENRLIEK